MMKTVAKMFTSISFLIAIIYIVVLLLAVYGWVTNIFKILGLIGSDVSTVAVELIIRLIGIPVAPLGAVAGFF